MSRPVILTLTREQHLNMISILETYCEAVEKDLRSARLTAAQAESARAKHNAAYATLLQLKARKP